MADNYTSLPWKAESVGRSFHICGDYHEAIDSDYDEGGFEVEEERLTCVHVATVHGNETSGAIADENAALIVRAVNCHADLLHACEVALKRLRFALGIRAKLVGTTEGGMAGDVAIIEAAVKKATRPTSES